MKYFLPFLIVTLLACKESYINLNSSNFNKQLLTKDDIKSPKELIKLFYNYPKNEGNPNLKITYKIFFSGNYKMKHPRS